MIDDNQLVLVEKPKLNIKETIISFFNKIGNGAKKFERGPISDLNMKTEKTIKDAQALNDKNISETIEFLANIEETNEKLVVGKESRTNTDIWKQVTKGKIESEQEQDIDVLIKNGENSKKYVIDTAKNTLDKTNQRQHVTEISKESKQDERDI